VRVYNDWARSQGLPTRRWSTLEATLQVLQGERKFSHWAPAEVEQLLKLAGEMPLDSLVLRHRRWAAKHGYPVRTHNGIVNQLAIRGISAKPEGDWITISAVARITGRSSTTIADWIRIGGLTVGGSGPGNRCILRKELRRLAWEKPQLFAGMSQSQLLHLLELDELAEAIARDYPNRHPCAHHGYPVIVVELGRRFPTMAAAARACHMERHAVARAVREGRGAGGFTFRRAS
jgi:hypothetical protein